MDLLIAVFLSVFIVLKLLCIILHSCVSCDTSLTGRAWHEAIITCNNMSEYVVSRPLFVLLLIHYFCTN